MLGLGVSAAAHGEGCSQLGEAEGGVSGIEMNCGEGEGEEGKMSLKRSGTVRQFNMT